VRRVFGLGLICTAAAWAAVTAVDIREHQPIPSSKYERLSGKVHFAVDPKLKANRKIGDIALAPTDAKGLVEFTADLLVYRPVEGAHSNGTALIDIPNRGGVVTMSAMQMNAAGRGITPADLGDMFLFQQGFTMIWIGWQWDVPEAPGVIKLHAPAAQGVRGLVRSEILVDRKTTRASLGDRNMTPYPVADPASLKLTVRDAPRSARREIPASQWKLGADKGSIEYPAGFEPGKFYEAVYTAQDPVVAGLGMAAVRDYISYIKHNGIQQAGDIKRALAYGNSQSGRFLRTFLYDGFNGDEQGKKVFEGVWANVSGSGRGSFNQRFSQPSRMSGQWNGIDNPVDLAPYEPSELLADAEKAKVAPKLMLTNGAHEYWGRAASLNHTSPDGKHDHDVEGDARIYFLAGTQHSTSANTANMKGAAQNPTNPVEWHFFLRAMLVAMNAWITDGTAPPPSLVPSIAKGELVSAHAVRFPKIPGIAFPKESYTPHLLNFGPEFVAKGIASIEPPLEGMPFETLVPQVNGDGNETSGVVMPEVRFPLATYTGWNLRDPKAGSPEGMYALQGSMIPFPRSKAEREKTGDPRASIEERYRNPTDYFHQIENAARQLAGQGFLLERDIPLVVARARTRWQALSSAGSLY